jgi:hypothetical protein
VYSQSFNDFPKKVGFDNGLLSAQPDMVEGLDLTRLGLFSVRDESNFVRAATLVAPAMQYSAIGSPYVTYSFSQAVRSNRSFVPKIHRLEDGYCRVGGL